MAIEPPGPGIYPNVPFEDYLSWPYLSQSQLKSFAECPAQYIYDLEHPKKSTDDMLRGSAADTLVFSGPDEFDALYCACPKGMKRDKRTTAYKKFLNEVAKGRLVLKHEEYEHAMDIAKSVCTHPDVAELLSNGQPQLTMVWQDPTTGLMCKGRIDFYSLAYGDPVLADMKVANSATSPDLFAKQILNMHYHWQAGWYCGGMSILHQYEHNVFKFIAVKPTPLHVVVPYTLAISALDLGRRQIKEQLVCFAQCKEANDWPMHHRHWEVIDLPTWEYIREEKEMTDAR